MDKYQITADAFNRLAVKSQKGYMDVDAYSDTYDKFCQLIENEHASILEIGCGPGNITHYLLNKKPDFEIFGIDVAQNMIVLARDNVPQAKFLMMDSREIQYLQQEFDAVVCGFCMPYMSTADVAELIVKLRKRLHRDGILYLSTFEGKDERNGIQIIDDSEKVYVHYHQAEFLIEQLIENNFEIIELVRKRSSDKSGKQPNTDLFIYAKAI